jgi:hypothetical protein
VRLPLRWTVIIALSAAVGISFGTLYGWPIGIASSVLTAAVLHLITS